MEAIEMLNAIATWIAELDYGSVPEWLEAIGALLAFGIALTIFRRDAHLRRTAQPRLVHAQMNSLRFHQANARFTVPVSFNFEAVEHTRSDRGTVKMLEDFAVATCTIHNNSEEAVFEVKTFFSYNDNDLTDGQDAYLTSDDYTDDRAMNPGGTKNVSIAFSTRGLEFDRYHYKVGVLFHDAVGTQWWRLEGNPVELVTGPHILTDHLNVLARPLEVDDDQP